ncbi:Predicted transcriptional regulator [Citrobacter koseri]|uniref:Predicted transcriptional regulator n=1 Tax=Citrobacter koseri TaxID=545 RepID=A0A3S4IWV2_CITKO|nr:Predicted transcriptional regulator [Citrobacter koseri]
MTLRKLLALSCLLLPMMASAHNFETHQRVSPIGIADRGELILDNNKFSYKSWNSAQLPGKVRVLQHIAGRTSAKEKNAALIEAIKSANLPHDRYQTTTIVNTDDAIPGTSMFVRSSIESNKNSIRGHNLLSTAMAWRVRHGSLKKRAPPLWCSIKTGVFSMPKTAG